MSKTGQKVIEKAISGGGGGSAGKGTSAKQDSKISAKGKRVIGGPFGIFRMRFNKGGEAMPKAKPN